MSVKILKARNTLFLANILILAVLLIVVWFWANIKDTGIQEELPFCLVYKQDGINGRITGFIEEEKIYYWIPGNIRLSDVHLEMDDAKWIRIGDKEFKAGDTLDEVYMNQEYEVMNFGADENNINTIIFMQGSEIPVIRLTTASGSLEYIHTEKGNREGGFLEVLDADGRLDTAARVKSISGRGHMSWGAEKRSYTVKLDDAENILKMGKEKTWVLNANYFDGAYIRNQAGFEIARNAGILYVPDEQFVDLYINNEYMGLYQIMEKIQAGKNRMDIGDDYLLEIDFLQRIESDDCVLLPNGQPLAVHTTGKNCDIEGVQRFFDNFSSYMETGNIALAMEKIDMESFAKMFVMEEILQDCDFGFTSHYMYLDLEDEILYEGPVWDLDNTMGRGTVERATNFFVMNFNLEKNNLSRWYARLYGQSDFRIRVSQEYKDFFRPAIVNLLEGGIEEKVTAIEASVSMDQKRYTNPRGGIMSGASMEEHIAYFTRYLQNKLRIMDECLGSGMTDESADVFLPELEVQKPRDAEEENGITEEAPNVLYYIMNYRFWFLLAAMAGSGVILSLNGSLRFGASEK